MEREGAADREDSVPAGPSHTAFSFTSLQVCLQKGERFGGPGRFEKTNHLGSKTKSCFVLAPPWPGRVS